MVDSRLEALRKMIVCKINNLAAMRQSVAQEILDALAAHESGVQYERIKIEMTGKKRGVTFISPGDAQRVTKGVHMRSGYATLATGKLHAFIMGNRPDHIPKDWVIDHKDRDKLNNSTPGT